MDQTLKLRINYSQFEFSKWVVYLLTRKHFTILTLKILQKFQRLYFIYFSLKETPLWGKLRNFTPSRQWTCKKKQGDGCGQQLTASKYLLERNLNVSK